MNQSLWDIIITGGVLGGLAILVISRITGMTLKDIVLYIKEIITGVKDTGEEVIGVAMVWDE